MPSDNSGQAIQPSIAAPISEAQFYTVVWLFFGLCTAAFLVRAYIRYLCFRRLLVDDWLMLLALVMHAANAILIQVYVRYAYTMEAAENGNYSVVGPDFFSNSLKGLRAYGASTQLSICGILVIKINFLLFFRALGRNLRVFKIFWWFVLLFTIVLTVIQLGMEEFNCMFGPASYIFSSACTDDTALLRNYSNAIFSVAADCFSDALIIIFPISILWKSRIDLRKKLILTFVFGLVALTIGTTIVRAGVFNGVFQSMNTAQAREQNVSWLWFWFYCEFSVAFIVACIVSFRTLFVHKENQASARFQAQQFREAAYNSGLRRGFRTRLVQIHGNPTYASQTLEGMWAESDAETLAMGPVLPPPPSGLTTADARHEDGWRSRKSAGSDEQGHSVQTPDPIHARE